MSICQKEHPNRACPLIGKCEPQPKKVAAGSGLAELRRNVETYMRKLERFTIYRCPQCMCAITTKCPTPSQVSSKGYWDSATVCMGCGELNFVCIWPTGRTLASIMGGRTRRETMTQCRPFKKFKKLINP